MADIETHLNTVSKKDKTIKSKIAKNMPKFNNILKKNPTIKGKKKFPSIRLSEEDRHSYHCLQTRKLHLSKCDPTMAFAFYLRNEGDFR